MDASTRAQLHAINRRFYDEHARAFDRKRGRPWPGWKDLLRRLDGLPASPRVLDAGCGNGRFGAFLANELPLRQAGAATPAGQSASVATPFAGKSDPSPAHPPSARIRYHGLDSSAPLLARADENLRALDNVEAELEQRDLIEDGLPENDYDLVVCFGVLHHVAGREQREALVRELAARLTPGGYLAFTCWRFLASPRVRGLRQPWPDSLREAEARESPEPESRSNHPPDADRPLATESAEPDEGSASLPLPEFEFGDALLDFDGRADALRYCHHVDEAEMIALMEAAAAEPEVSAIDRWKADGATGDLNHYALLRRAEQQRIAR